MVDSQRKTVRIEVRITPNGGDLLAKIAAARGWSMSQTVRTAVSAWASQQPEAK